LLKEDVGCVKIGDVVAAGSGFSEEKMRKVAVLLPGV